MSVSFLIQRLSIARVLVSAVLPMSVLVACAKSSPTDLGSKSAEAPIHGMNYTVEPFSFVVSDPIDPSNAGGGEVIDAYSAGGSMCCFALPIKWRAGLSVRITETVWESATNDGKSVPRSKKHMVNVPVYRTADMGALWVSKELDGTLSVVSSNLQPDHPNWSGKTRGWPVPSVKYQRKLQDRAIAEEQINIRALQHALEELRVGPDKYASEEWDSIMSFDPKKLAKYSGPADPGYGAMLQAGYESDLARLLKNVERMKAQRP